MSRPATATQSPIPTRSLNPPRSRTRTRSRSRAPSLATRPHPSGPTPPRPSPLHRLPRRRHPLRRPHRLRTIRHHHRFPLLLRARAHPRMASNPHRRRRRRWATRTPHPATGLPVGALAARSVRPAAARPAVPGIRPAVPAYGQSPYATGAPAPSNTSAIILTIVSGVSMLSTAFLVGIPSLIFGIMALTSNSTDPVGSRKKSRTGWIIFAVNGPRWSSSSSSSWSLL